MAEEEGTTASVTHDISANAETARKSSSNVSPSSSSNVAWLVGDLVWSKIPGHPWWPSMVAYEPNTAVYFRMKGRTRFYHVQFFGEDPVRGWISERSIIKFEGKEKFLSLGMVTHGKLHKVSTKQQPSWDHAVKVAEQGVPMNRHERQLCYTFRYDRKDMAGGEWSAGQTDIMVNGAGGKRGKKSTMLDQDVALGNVLPTLEPNEILENGEGIGLEGVVMDDLGDFVDPKKSNNLAKSESVVDDGTGKTTIPTLLPSPAKPGKGKKRKKEDTLVELPKDPPSKRKKQSEKIGKTQVNGMDNPPPKTYTFPLTPESPQFLNGCVSPTTPEKLHSMPLVNGEVSPNTALKLKIRKVKTEDENNKPRKRGRPPKKVETFVIVESSVSDTDSYSDSSAKTPSPLSDVFMKSPSPPESNESLSPVKKEVGLELKVEKEVEVKKTKPRRKLKNKESETEPVPVNAKTNLQRTETKSTKLQEAPKPDQKGKKTGPTRGRKPKAKKNVDSSKDLVNEIPSGENIVNEDTVAKKQKKKKADVDEMKNGNKEKVLQNATGIVEKKELETASVETASAQGSNDGSSTSLGKTPSRREAVCMVCENTEDLIFCDGICNSSFHVDCLGLSRAPDGKFVCDECVSGTHSCFACKETGDVMKCAHSSCGKFYHMNCVKTLHNAKIEGEKFTCPLHCCGVCGPKKSALIKGRLIRCVRCPVAYHVNNCFVAGCQPITSQLMVCMKHFKPTKGLPQHTHVNVNWCFVCSVGGTLICCESCPAAFHPECINYESIPEGHFFCKDCTEGKQLLYGEIVWVKLGSYRWWPAQICHPNDVPTNIKLRSHQPGEFAVQFQGSHDYFWIHRGRVFSYQEGDKGSLGGSSKHLADIFKRALEEAKEKYALWKKAQEVKEEEDQQKMCRKPPLYKHIKVNKYTTGVPPMIDENEMPICECKSTDENPCGPDSHCLNRMLLFECNAKRCPAGEKCQNQRFQRREYAKVECTNMNKRGFGLGAKQDIKKGDFVIEYVGELVDEGTCLERVKKGSEDGVTNYYMLTIDKDLIIDAGPMGNLARFMNHSCDPNCETQKWCVNSDKRVGLFAIRDIQCGEELTFDYQLDCLGNEKKICYCGSKNCSGFLGVRPKTAAAQLQEERSKRAQEKRKKRRKKKEVKEVVHHEDDCFICGDGGELIMCDKAGCVKCYHMSCLELKDRPYGKWECPWHFCDMCGKRAFSLCSECPNSFCKDHAEGEIIEIEQDRLVCADHILTRNKKKGAKSEAQSKETTSNNKPKPQAKNTKSKKTPASKPAKTA